MRSFSENLFTIYMYVLQCSRWALEYEYWWKISENLFTIFVLQSSQWALVLWSKTNKTLFGPVIFSVFFKELYKNKLKNLIWTSKFKCSFWGLVLHCDMGNANTSYTSCFNDFYLNIRWLFFHVHLHLVSCMINKNTWNKLYCCLKFHF